MSLVYDNNTCEQAIFTYAFPGQNLNNDNIVFTVKKIVINFKRDFPLLFKDFMEFIINRFSCRKLANWINNNG